MIELLIRLTFFAQAVIRFLGSFINILLIRSFAEADVEGHGALSKSM